MMPEGIGRNHLKNEENSQNDANRDGFSFCNILLLRFE
jgi:hypothetical protein